MGFSSLLFLVCLVLLYIYIILELKFKSKDFGIRGYTLGSCYKIFLLKRNSHSYNNYFHNLNFIVKIIKYVKIKIINYNYY